VVPSRMSTWFLAIVEVSPGFRSGSPVAVVGQLYPNSHSSYFPSYPRAALTPSSGITITFNRWTNLTPCVQFDLELEELRLTIVHPQP